jgi:endo-1,4-beta-xylanase
VQVANDLRSRGIPLDGIGHEMHNAINFPSTQSMVGAINTVAASVPGVEQQITEMDMSVYNAGDTTSNYGNNIPPAVLAEQGWLYAQYFAALRQLNGKLSAVTFWGFADDDTWLDGFPVARTDYPLPFNMGLQAKPAYWGIVDPTQLPGYGMTFSASVVPGERDTRTVTITATNGDVGPAYTTQISGFTLTQISGPSCSPTITAPGSSPIALGDIPTSGSASASFVVSIVGCNPNSEFKLTVPWSSAVYDTGVFGMTLDFRR